MDAITFLRNKGILGEIHTKWMITFSDGSQVDLVQLFDEFAALRQPAVIGRSEQLVCDECCNEGGTFGVNGWQKCSKGCIIPEQTN